MTLLASHPETIRSAVLDSLDPLSPDLGAPWSVRVADARDAFFAARPHEPPLATLYQTALARLRSAPPALDLPPWAGTVRLTPSLFEELVGRLVYFPVTSSRLPELLAATAAGDVRPAQTALADLLDQARRAGNEGAFTAVECRDRASWRDPATYRDALDLALLPPGVCEAWSPLAPEPEFPRHTAVPTLVLAGEFDPNTRPPQSRHVAARLGAKVRWIEVAGAGHSVRHFSVCAQRLVSAFIDDPAEPLDATCAGIDPQTAKPPPKH